MNNAEILLVSIVVAGFALVAWWVVRSRSATEIAALAAETAKLARRLEDSFGRATADMAARVEQVRGDLRSDLSDRLQSGLREVREVVDRQLSEGRSEQGQRLGQAVGALEQKFDGFRLSTESRLDQFGERQAQALKETRAELASGIGQLTAALQARFEQLSESLAQSSRQSRAELAQSLGESTKALQQRFEGLEQRTSQNLEAIRAKVDERLQAISEQVQAKLEKNIQEGFAHFQKVQEHLKAAEEQLRSVGAVGQSINELNSLLKLPHLRGKFGEAELSRLLADFLPATAFEEQVAVVPGSRELVDAVVKFPKYRLPIDSKFNREQILPLFETGDPEGLRAAREQLAVSIRQQARSISEKYIHPEHGTADMALMFLPSETIYFEVIRDGGLLEAIHKLRVFPVSPNTLVIALRAIEMGIAQYEFARGVEKTLEQVKQAQLSFGFFQKKFDEVGRGLEKAQEAYQTASGHLNRYSNRVVRMTGEPPPELPESTDAARL